MTCDNLRACEFFLELLLKKRHQTPEKTVHPRIQYDESLKEWQVGLVISLSKFRVKSTGTHRLQLNLTPEQFEETITLYGITKILADNTHWAHGYRLDYGKESLGMYRVIR